MDVGILAGTALMVFGPKSFPTSGPGFEVRHPLIPSRLIKEMPKSILILFNRKK
jgi:hypothetical protein